MKSCVYIQFQSIKQVTLKLMSKKNKTKKTNNKNLQTVVDQQPEKNNTLIFGGILLAMSSIGLLIFVLSDKVFYLN